MVPPIQSSSNTDGAVNPTKKTSPPSPNESLEDLKRQVAVLQQEKLHEERARNYAQLERVRIWVT
jgi:hypothetical protein